MGTTKNQPIVDTLREAARILTEGKGDSNIYCALDEATAPVCLHSMWTRLLDPAGHDGSFNRECRMLDFENDNERVMLLLLLAEMLEQGDL